MNLSTEVMEEEQGTASVCSTWAANKAWGKRQLQ